MDYSARPKFTVEEFPSVEPGPGIMQPHPPKPKPAHPVPQVYVKPEEPQTFVPNTSPVGYAGDPVSSNMPSTAQPQLFGQPAPVSQPLYQQPTPNVVKQSSGSSLSIRHLKFIIPALLLIVALVAAAIFVPKYLDSLNSAPPAPPEPTLIPATPVPTPDTLPRTKSYLNIDKEISFEYLSSFVLVECDEKIVFLVTRPENSEDTCTQEHSGILEIVMNGEVHETALSKVLEGAENNYVVILLDQKYEQLFNKIIETAQFVDPNLTDGWERYTSSSGYNISYPPEWTLIPAEEREGSNVTEIRKNVTETKFHNLAIKMTPNVANAGLSASEIISSLQGLSGWKDRPTVEFRVIGGESAHVLQGEYEGVWKVNVVVWKGTSLVEMTWQDQITQPERTTFEGLLSTFSFSR